MLPAATWPGRRTSPMTAANVTLLPEPDSPTTPRHSPGRTSRSTPSTAVTTPERVAKRTTRPRIASSGAAAPFGPGARSVLEAGIEGIAQSLARDVDREHQDQDRQAGKGADPPGVEHEFASVGHHRTPRGRRRLHAEPEERQAGFEDDHVRQADRGHHDDRRQDVRQDLADHDAERRDADRARRFDVLH